MLTLAVAGPAWAQLGDLFKQFPQLPGATTAPGALDDVKIGDGLKEALRVGAGAAVDLTGKVDGYFANQAIRIVMPPRLSSLEQGVRMLGYGDRVDELVLSMNRAAEQAAPAARRIFLDAIGAMTIGAARRIFDGGDTAATDYFKEKTTGTLTTAFRPAIARTMSQVGVARQYDALLGQARQVPFLDVGAFDLNTYVLGKALDGLFHVLGEQERKIRTEPAARVTDLLRDVFGRR